MSWQIERSYEREAEALQRQYDEGQLTRQEFNEAMRQLDRDARDAYEEERQRAHDEVDQQFGGW